MSPFVTNAFTEDFFLGFRNVIDRIDPEEVRDVVRQLQEMHGRLFILGVGGSAANASHAVNDFRKLCRIQAYAPTDNVSELTARTNDEGWENVFVPWLSTNLFGRQDALLILSVGGGDREKNISVNLIKAIDYAKDACGTVLGIVGRKGYTYEHANACILVPESTPEMTTPYAEAMQSVILHLLVSHPSLKQEKTKWEGLI